MNYAGVKVGSLGKDVSRSFFCASAFGALTVSYNWKTATNVSSFGAVLCLEHCTLGDDTTIAMKLERFENRFGLVGDSEIAPP